MFHCSYIFVFVYGNQQRTSFFFNMAINQELVFLVTIVDDKLLCEGKIVNEVTFKFHK